MIMERNSIQIIGDLKEGDRFCFPGDFKKGNPVYEVTSVGSRNVMYKDDGRYFGSKPLDHKVIFLRSTALKENS
jgi:hypothetical protein